MAALSLSPRSAAAAAAAARAPSRDPLEEVVSCFERQDAEGGMKLFSQLPKTDKNAIYGRLWEVMGRPEIPEYGQKAFEGTYPGDQPPLAKKLEAVRQHLAQQSEKIGRRTRQELCVEFSTLDARKRRYVSSTYPTESQIGRRAENGPFNRCDIIPHDRTIVPVQGGAYLNANYAHARRHILTQCPLPATIDTFWQMTYEQEVVTIVQLNEPHEKNGFYLPEEIGRETVCGRLRLTLLDHSEILVHGQGSVRGERNRVPAISCRTLLLRSPGKPPVEVTHLHYSNWVDARAPEERGMLTLIKEVRRAQKNSQAPIVVHCWAGVGRTGTFALIDQLTHELSQGREIDIAADVEHQRSSETGRSPHMVGTEEQYLFCHRFLENFRASALLRRVVAPSAIASLHSIPHRLFEVAVRKEPLTREGALAKVALLFEAGREEEALKALAEVPSDLTEKVFGQLWRVMGEPRDVPHNYGELALYNGGRYAVPPAKKVEAIRAALQVDPRELATLAADVEQIIVAQKIPLRGDAFHFSLQPADFEPLFKTDTSIAESLIALLKKDPILKKLFEGQTGVGETLEVHVKRVIKNFERYFSKMRLPAGLDPFFFRVFLALHDVAKPGMLDIRRSDERISAEHEITFKIMEKVFTLLGYRAPQIAWCQHLVAEDPLGDYLKASGAEAEARAAKLVTHVKRAAAALGVPAQVYLDLHLCYFLCDAGSYTENAGWRRSLDDHFVFDSRKPSLELSGAYRAKMERIFKMLEG